MGEKKSVKSPEAMRRLTALLDQSDDAIMLIASASGQFHDANQTACQLLGYKYDALLGTSIADLQGTLAHPWAVALHSALRVSPPPRFQTVVHNGQNGTPLIFDLTLNHISFNDKSYLLVMAHDITPWDLATANPQVGNATSSQTDPRQVLENIAGYAMQLSLADVSCVLAFDPDLKFMASGTSETFCKDIALCVKDILQHKAYKQLLLENQIVPLPDLPGEPDSQLEATLAEQDLHAALFVPIPRGEQLIGLMFIGQQQAYEITQEELIYLQTLAQHSASALENARLLASLAEEKSRFEILYRLGQHLATTLDIHEVGQRALEELATLIHATRSLIIVHSADSHGLELAATLGYTAEDRALLEHYIVESGHGTAGWMAENKQTMVIDEVRTDPRWDHFPNLDEDIRSALCVPLISGQTLVGILTLASDKPAFFAPYHRQLAESTAAPIAVALTNAQLYREDHRMAQDQKLVAEITRALNVLQIKSAYPVLAEKLKALTGCCFIALAMLDDEHKHLTMTPLTGSSTDPNDVLREYIIALTDLPGYQEMMAGKSLVSMEIDALEPSPLPWLNQVSDCPIRGWIGLPLHASGHLIGALCLGYPHVEHDDPTEHAMLWHIANAIAITVENSRLFQSEQRQRELAERLQQAAVLVNASLDRTEVLELILDQLGQVVPNDSSTLQILEDERMRVIAERNLAGDKIDTQDKEFPLATCAYARTLAMGDGPIIVPDVQEDDHPWRIFDQATAIRSNIGVSLWIRDQVIGALTLDSHQPYAYTEDDARIVQAFAQQAAIAIENARLFAAEQTQREMAEALEAATSVITRTLDLDQVLDRILEQTARVVDGDTFNIMLIEDDKIRIVRRRGYESIDADLQPEVLHQPFATYPNLLRMLRTGRPIVTPDTVNDPDWISSLENEWRRSYVAAPIHISGETVGFLNVNGTRPNQFDEHDAQRLKAFADHAAIAIQNARHYERQRHYADELEQRVQRRTMLLQAQKAWLEAILSSTTDAIFVTDSDGQIVQSNRVANIWLRQTLPPDEVPLLRTKIRELAQRAKERPEILIELNGMDLQLGAAPISEQEAAGPAVVLVGHDVTHLKTLERMKSRFVSNVSHELRTPLSSIQLYASLLQKATPHRQEQYLQALDQEVAQITRLIEDILEVSRIDAASLDFDPRPVDFDQMIATAVASYQLRAGSEGVTLRYQAQTPDVQALIDPDKFSHVVGNLIINAINYTPEGGHINVSTTEQTIAERAWAALIVTDTGMGIPASELDHIFERFYRGERPRRQQIRGSGLGLSIVKEIVKLHGGQVTIESEVDVGSTFTVRVPLA